MPCELWELCPRSLSSVLLVTPPIALTECGLTLRWSGTSTGMALGPRGAAGLCSASRAKRHSGVGPSAQTLGRATNTESQHSLHT